MPDFYVTGAKQFARAAEAARSMDKVQRREVLKVVQTESKPLRAGLKGSARATLPREGGLNEVVAASTISARSKTTGKDVGVTISARGRNGRLKDIRATDSGLIRKPVFPRPGQARSEWTWATQRITPGWWSKPIAAFGPTVAKSLGRAMTRVVDDIARRSK